MQIRRSLEASTDKLRKHADRDRDVAVAKLRLEPVVLIKAIASQTPAIAGTQGCLRSADRGGHRAKIGANATRRARAPTIAALWSGTIRASDGPHRVDAMQPTESPSTDSRVWALPAEAVA